MNLQQVQYILALSKLRHFEQAAEECFVTQSTLSTMISRFENEIGIRIFDRKRKPVQITKEGAVLIEQLHIIQKNLEHLNDLVEEIRGEVSGELSIAAIPTIAPFLLPLFIQSFAKNFPQLRIVVKEMNTEEILKQVKSRKLDIGILSIPVQDPELSEIELYHEPFVYYQADAQKQGQVTADKLDMSTLCLLEEGHCMRTQVLKLCDLQKRNLEQGLSFEFKAGSIDSLLRFVRANQASTLLPLLSTVDFPSDESKKLSFFRDPVPYRKVGLLVHQHFAKHKVLEHLKICILDKIKGVMPAFQPDPDSILDPLS